ncbi:MAG: YqgE/AlgH family protein [Opitutales bacterium]|nr:YqgE/AlgH family protein [Opitutales bacterium]
MRSSSSNNLSGKCLVAHPSLADPNFRRSVIHLSLDSAEEGSLGIILNRPMNTTLGRMNRSFLQSPMADLPLFFGGPVQPEEMILAAWQWDEDEGIGQFHFGIPMEVATLLMANPNAIVRGYMGYAGWSVGQLAEELQEKAWLVADPCPEMLEEDSPVQVWREFIQSINPTLSFLANIPEDPSVN